MASAGVVLGIVVQKAQETVLAAWDVDELEEVDKDLGDVFDVVVNRGACDGGEVRCGVGEEGVYILRKIHGVLG